ncbi:MAG: hypothetical protein ABFC24_04770 [Methanoregulaceae archaeon]
MKRSRVAVLACFAVVMILVLILAASRMEFPAVSATPADPEILVTDSDFTGTHQSPGQKTAMFSKYVSPDLPYIVVDLDSGDLHDPLSLSIITPDRVLGPYTDESDGLIDGRIYLQISKSDGMTPGLWKFIVHSNKTIIVGSGRQYPEIPATAFDHKDDD